MACNLVGPEFLKYEQELHAFLFRKVKDKDEAHDILQEVLLKVHKNWEQLSKVKNTRAWLFTITRNALTDHWREKQRYPTESLSDGITEQEEGSIYQQLEALMPAFLQFLPEKYRLPLALSDLEGMPQQEIAERLSISLSGAKSRIQRARSLLRNKFSECLELELNERGIPTDYAVKPHCQEAVNPTQPQLTTCCKQASA